MGSPYNYKRKLAFKSEVLRARRGRVAPDVNITYSERISIFDLLRERGNTVRSAIHRHSGVLPDLSYISVRKIQNPAELYQKGANEELLAVRHASTEDLQTPCCHRRGHHGDGW